jgi:hypothetical protein
MGTIRKAKSAEIDPSSSASAQIATDANASAAAWWAQWAKDHEAQIEAYNRDVADKGVWSDGLRTF